jgi:hypothetical protein
MIQLEYCMWAPLDNLSAGFLEAGVRAPGPLIIVGLAYADCVLIAIVS